MVTPENTATARAHFSRYDHRKSNGDKLPLALWASLLLLLPRHYYSSSSFSSYYSSSSFPSAVTMGSATVCSKKEAHGPAEPMRAARPGFNPRADLFAFCFYSPKPRPSVVRFPPTATISGPPPVGLPLRQKAKGGGGAGGAGVEWGVQAALAA